jgi:hypothetical protein
VQVYEPWSRCLYSDIGLYFGTLHTRGECRGQAESGRKIVLAQRELATFCRPKRSAVKTLLQIDLGDSRTTRLFVHQ